MELPPLNRPIILPDPAEPGRTVRLDADAVDRLRFRQINVKEAFTLQDALGRYFRASLLALGARGGEALVYEELARSPESPLCLTLFCAVPSRQRMLLVVQKATELGVMRVQPVLSEHSVPAEGLEHEKAHAWPGQALRAARQCRRATVPVISPALPLADALADEAWRGAGCRLYLDDRADENTAVERGPETAALAVGPEGGWSAADRTLLRAAGGTPWILGGRVLRAETAALVGLTVLQHLLGDLVP